MPNQKYTSPGVYTSEKDLSFIKKGSGNNILEVAGGDGTNNNSIPVIKPTFWILRCGIWEDGGTWLSYAKWEDSPIWPCK